jgi:hypothetical protein
MFHDMGLTHAHSSPDKRFEVDGANVAADFLRSRGIGEREVEKVWTAIALHTTPGIPEFMAPEIALVTAGVEMDVLGIRQTFADADREPWCTRTHARISRKTSSRRSTTASSTSPIPRSATSRPM